MQNRIAKALVVELVRQDTPASAEIATTQNVSFRGMRVITKSAWLPPSDVLVGFPQSGLLARARRVYCQSSEEGFALGLELAEPAKERAMALWHEPGI